MIADTLLSSEEKNKNNVLRFGIRTWRPDCIQKFNSIGYFLFALCLFSFSQGAAVNGIVTASIASIEKEFGLNSKIIGIIVSGNDASSLMVVGFVSFFGSVHNKAFMISVGAFITGFGALMFALPKFIAGDYYPKDFRQNALDICRLNKTAVTYCETMPVNQINTVVFFIANFIMGAGTTPLYTLGPAYLDENVSPKIAPICIGVLFASSILGRGFGYLISSIFLRIFTNINHSTINQNTLLTVKDSEWVGAWWLGFFLCFGLLIISGFLLLFFPKQLPGGEEKRELAKQQGKLPLSDSRVKYNIKGFIVESIKLLKNKVFMFSVLGLTVKTLFGVSIGTFFAKLLIIKFGVSPDKASMILSAVLFPTMMGGVLGGSLMMRKWELKAAGKNSMKFCFIASVVGGIFSVLFLIPGCRNTNLAGVIVPYPNQMLENSLNSLCNSNCTCSEKSYLPVCGSDGITYSSPCYAGCQTALTKRGKVAYFQNCSCVIESNKKSFNLTNSNNYATPGKCERNCKNAYIFVFSTAFVIVLSFLSGTPHKIAVLRCVPDNHRAFALGMQLMIMRSISFLPGPIILGAVIDSQCITWSYGKCGQKLNCLDYNSDRLSLNLVIFGVVTSVIGSILYFLAWWCYPKLSVDYEIKLSDVKDNIEKIAHT